MSAKRAPTRAHIQPFCFPSTSRGTRTRTPNRATAFEAVVSAIPPHWPCKRSTVFYVALVPPVGLEPTHPNGYLILSQARLPIPPQRPKKGSGNKHEQQPRDYSAPNQRGTRTPAAPSASPTRVRGHSQPAHPDRPNLLTNTESTLAQTPKRHPHTPSAHYHAATPPCVTATAAALRPRVVSAPRSA